MFGRYAGYNFSLVINSADYEKTCECPVTVNHLIFAASKLGESTRLTYWHSLILVFFFNLISFKVIFYSQRATLKGNRV